MRELLPFRVEARDGNARAGTLQTPRGVVQTPIFMPVGTVGTVKSLMPDELEALGAQIILANTYHLYLRPGEPVLEQHGGLHRMMGWDRPILTDSGGYQFFSLRHLARFDRDGVTFQSHVDGSRHRFTPERVIDIQRTIGSDVMMVLDHCSELPAPRAALERAMATTTDWALRSLRHVVERPAERDGAVFAILQGGTEHDLRVRHRDELCAHEFDGFAVGGLSVGEAPAVMYDVLETAVPGMPQERPRYLMGVGRPEDLVAGIERGVDMFDCVMPTRNARNGGTFTRTGRLNMRNGRHRTDERPIDERCGCPACRRFTRSYILHLFRTNEMLGPRLVTLHNLHYYLDLVTEARAAIAAGRFASWAAETRSGWAAAGESS